MSEFSVLDGVKRLALLWPLCWFIGFGFGWVILKPLRAASTSPQAATQFRLTDFLVLLGVLFAVGWLPLLYYERITQERLLTSLLFLHSLIIAWWWWGLRLVARARIQAPKARAVILGVALPLACGGSLAFIAAPVAVSEMISGAMRMTGDVQAQGNKLVEFLYWATKVVPLWALLGLAAFWGSRRLAHWAGKHRLDGEPEEDEPF
jgi:hypothetical protein